METHNTENLKFEVKCPGTHQRNTHIKEYKVVYKIVSVSLYILMCFFFLDGISFRVSKRSVNLTGDHFKDNNNPQNIFQFLHFIINGHYVPVNAFCLHARLVTVLLSRYPIKLISHI